MVPAAREWRKPKKRRKIDGCYASGKRSNRRTARLARRSSSPASHCPPPLSTTVPSGTDSALGARSPVGTPARAARCRTSPVSLPWRDVDPPRAGHQAPTPKQRQTESQSSGSPGTIPKRQLFRSQILGGLDQAVYALRQALFRGAVGSLLRRVDPSPCRPGQRVAHIRQGDEFGRRPGAPVDAFEGCQRPTTLRQWLPTHPPGSPAPGPGHPDPPIHGGASSEPHVKLTCAVGHDLADQLTEPSSGRQHGVPLRVGQQGEPADQSRLDDARGRVQPAHRSHHRGPQRARHFICSSPMDLRSECLQQTIPPVTSPAARSQAAPTSEAENVPLKGWATTIRGPAGTCPISDVRRSQQGERI
jgi:hypothetical protein